MAQRNGFFLGVALFWGALVTASAQTQFLPQLAVGGPPSGKHFRTILFLMNPTFTPVSGTAQIFNNDGIALPVVLPAGQQSSIDWTLGPGQAARYVLSGRNETTVETGWVRVTPGNNRPVGVSLVYQYFDGDTLLSEAGVLSSPAQYETAVIFDRSPGVDTGLAIVNPNAQPISVTAVLQDLGVPIGSPQQVPVARNGHRQFFLTDIFPGVTLPATGTVILSAGAPFSAVALRIANDTKLSAVPVLPTAQALGGVPELLTLSAASGSRGQTIDPLVLTGNNLINTVSINVDPPGSDLQPTILSIGDTQVRARLAIGGSATAGVYRLTVTTRAAGVDQTSNALTFYVNPPCP